MLELNFECTLLTYLIFDSLFVASRWSCEIRPLEIVFFTLGKHYKTWREIFISIPSLEIQGRHFNFFLGVNIFLYFSMPPDYWKIGKNSTLYAVIWHYSMFPSFFLSFFSFFSLFSFLFFFFFFFSFSLGGATAPQPPSNDAPVEIMQQVYIIIVPLLTTRMMNLWNIWGGGRVGSGRIRSGQTVSLLSVIAGQVNISPGRVQEKWLVGRGQLCSRL